MVAVPRLVVAVVFGAVSPGFRTAALASPAGRGLFVKERGNRAGCDSSATSFDGPPGEVRPSPGCYKSIQERRLVDESPYQTIRVDEGPKLESSLRQFLIDRPKKICTDNPYCDPTPLPLVLWAHGQYGNITDSRFDFAERSGFQKCATQNNAISVYPQGVDDFVDGMVYSSNKFGSHNGNPDLGTGWNVGTSGDEETCLTERWMGMKPTEYSCYSSCLKLKQCGRCNWSTCRNDIAFIKAILSKVTNEYCVDLSRMYFAGQSNGGMLTHHVSHVMPNTFAAFAVLYGAPLLGYVNGRHSQIIRNRDAMRDSAFLSFHDRGDHIIPLKGGLAKSDGWTWYYASQKEVMSLWSGIHACDPEATRFTLPFEVSPDVECFEHTDCKSGKRVILCLYDGHHGDLPGDKSSYGKSAFGNALFWFFNQFRRPAAGTW